MLGVNISAARKHPGQPQEYKLSAKLGSIDTPCGQIDFTAPVETSIELVFEKDQVSLRGTATGSYKIICVRCLEYYERSFKLDLVERYATITMQNVAGDPELNMLNEDWLEFSDKVIASIILDLPMQPICHPECQGLCSQCGYNLNFTTCSCSVDRIDPRLAKLSKLLES